MEGNSSWKWRWSKLVRKIERVHTLGERQELIERLSKPDRPLILAFANAHSMNLLAKSESFFKSLCDADTVLRDGSGMETLFNQLRIPPGLNLNGTDLIPDLISLFNGRCIALLGTQEPYLRSGVDFVEKNLAPQSNFVHANGFHEEKVYLLLAAESCPALIVLGMGMPRQEEVAIALRSTLSYPCLIVCGGAIIDFWGGRTTRAPLWMRRNGMEWFFRLQLEPKRLFQRYVTGNMVFLVRALIFPFFNSGLIQKIFRSRV